MRVSSDISFVRFVYPFAIDADAETIRQNITRLTQHDWRKAQFPESDLLPHVRDFLNPSDENEATAYLLTLSSETLTEKTQRMICQQGNVPDGSPSSAPWSMRTTDRVICFSLEEAQLMIFRGGVALLTLEARLQSEELHDWLDFIYHFRFFAGKADDGQDVSAPELNYQGAPMEGIKPLYDFLLQPLHLANYEDLFMRNLTLPYSALYLEGDFDAEKIRRLLYRIRLCFANWHQLYPPAEELRTEHPSMMEYAENLWFTFAQQGAGFVAFNAPGDANDFFRSDFPKRLRSRYFLLYSLALYQKFMLIRLSDRVSESWLQGNESERIATFSKIRDALLEFTARGYFAQVMQLEQHHRYYCLWRQVLQLETLYQEVNNEVREMHDYLQLRFEEQRVKQSEYLNRVVLGLTGVTVICVLPNLVVSGLGMNVSVVEQWDKSWGNYGWVRYVLLAFVMGFVILIAILLWARRPRKPF